MKAVIQRVSSSFVKVNGEVVGQIGLGLNVLLGVAPDDTEKEAWWLARKIVDLRIFQDDEGKMNRSLLDVGGSLLVVSQFTLFGDCRRGRRPSYTGAARPEHAIPMYERFVQICQELGVPVQTGRFGAMMEVSIQNDGPVTLILERTCQDAD